MKNKKGKVLEKGCLKAALIEVWSLKGGASLLYCCFSYGTCAFCVRILYIVSCHNYMYWNI